MGKLLKIILVAILFIPLNIKAKNLPDPAVNRLFENMEEYPKYKDDYKNISFSPSKPLPGQNVVIKVKVFNLGEIDSGNIKVFLYDKDEKIGERNIRNLKPHEEKIVEFKWKAKEGFHPIIAKVEAKKDAKVENNYLLRVLIVGDRRKAHPYLFLYPDEIEKWKEKVLDGIKEDSWLKRIYKAVKAYGEAHWYPGDYHEIRGQYAHNAAIISILEGREDLSKKAIEILKSMKNPGKVYVSTRPGSWDDRQRICGLANYCMAYDLVAPKLSEEEDKYIRRLIAKEIKHHYDYIRNPSVFKKYRGSFGYIVTGFTLSALTLADYDDTEKGYPDYKEGEPSYGKGSEWLHFGLNAIYLEFNRYGFQWDPSGYYLSGFGYLGQFESRCAGACWVIFKHIGYNLFEVYPFIEDVHKYYLKVMLPNGWPPPTDDSAFVTPLTNGMCVFSNLFVDKHAQAVARWVWENRHLKERSEEWMDGHWYYIFLYRATPQDLKGKKESPKWPPTMFFTTHQVFRSDWSEDASYLMLNTKHCKGAHGHNQNDGCSIQYYAKKAYLIVDPGYGQGGGFHNRYVKPWCRGNTYNQSMILIDGKRPGPQWENSYYPENRFRLDTIDYGESVAEEIMGWAGSIAKIHTGIKHIRSVIFSKIGDYFAVIDRIRDKKGKKHTYEFVLVGNARHPYKSDKEPGDIVKRPNSVSSVPLIENLKIKDVKNGKVAEWIIENMDGKDVKLQAYFPEIHKGNFYIKSGDGWLGYRQSWAGRCKYIAATVKDVPSANYLCILSSYLVDEKSNLEIRTLKDDEIKGSGIYRTGVEIKVKGGLYEYIGFKEGKGKLGLLDKIESDGEIFFLREGRDGKVKSILIVDGKFIKYKKDFVISSEGQLEHLGIEFYPEKIKGHVNAEKPVKVKIYTDTRPEKVIYIPDTENWLKGEIGIEEKKIELQFSKNRKYILISIPEGSGRIIIQ